MRQLLAAGMAAERHGRPGSAAGRAGTPSASAVSNDSDITHSEQWWLPQPHPSLDEDHSEWRPAVPMAEALQCSVCKDLLKEAITAAECGHSCRCWRTDMKLAAMLSHQAAEHIAMSRDLLMLIAAAAHSTQWHGLYTMLALWPAVQPSLASKHAKSQHAQLSQLAKTSGVVLQGQSMQCTAPLCYLLELELLTCVCIKIVPADCYDCIDRSILVGGKANFCPVCKILLGPNPWEHHKLKYDFMLDSLVRKVCAQDQLGVVQQYHW